MLRLGLIPHLGKEKAVGAARDLISWLEGKGIEALLHPDAARLLSMPERSFGHEDIETRIDLALVLGGDGALLGAARFLAGSGLPILGINVGHLGFLTEVDLSEAYDALERVLAGKYVVEERMMVEARVIRDGEEVKSFVGLNDIVVTKGAFARMIRLETYVDDNYIGTYPADGVIVATPTGSTAYSLSAGGPIVNPAVESLIVTFICPHTLFARSLVLSDQEVAKIRVLATHEEVMLTVDGQVGYELSNRDEVVAQKSAHRTRLVRFKTRNFYEVLRTHLRRGGL